jgi:hypothetical protein
VEFANPMGLVELRESLSPDEGRAQQTWPSLWTVGMWFVEW